MSDLDGLLFRKLIIGGRAVLVPSDVHADEWLAGCSTDKDVMVTGRKPRNPDHHRLLFAMLRKTVENTDDTWADESDLLLDLKEATGLATEKANPLTGRLTLRSGSISFAAMDQDTFKRWYDRAVFKLCTFLGIQWQQLSDEVFDMAYGDKRPAWKMGEVIPFRRTRR